VVVTLKEPKKKSYFKSSTPTIYTPKIELISITSSGLAYNSNSTSSCYFYSAIILYVISCAKLGSRQSVPGHIKLDL
jgi:hypothetical protein